MKFQRGIGILALLFCIVVISGFIAVSIYLIRIDDVVREKFEGQRWDIPAKVFARPLELHNNAPVSPEDFNKELQLLGYKSSDNYNKVGQYVKNGNTFYVHTRGFDFGDFIEPEQVLKVSFDGQRISDVSSTKPTNQGIARLEPMLIGGIYPQHNEDRVLIKLDKVPKPLIQALIATEDRNFYHHFGISIRGTARAIVSNVTGGKRQGGSTLTQQLVKNFYLTPERTLKRKANEAVMALLINLHYSKDEVLEAYLNEVNLGQNGNYSINGYGLAAQFYFGLPLRELNIAQQAFLVGLVQGPSLYNPWRNPESALKRRNIVLNNMLVMGYISQADYETEKARPLGVLAKPTLSPARYPDFMDIVRRQLRSEYQDSDLSLQGLRIFTTLDPIAQTKVQQTFKSSVAKFARGNRNLADLQGAVVITRPDNGELLATVGSSQDFTGFNRAIDAKRQVGSLLKPIIYLNALESGRYNWASLIDDSRITIPMSNGKDWTPKNYSNREYGLVPMQEAFAQSYNLSAVHLADEFGLPTFASSLRKFGATSTIPTQFPSIYLGAVEMSPLEMAQIYGNFASGGNLHPVRAIRNIVDNQGQRLQRFGLDTQKTISPAGAYLINYGLEHVMKAGTGRAGYEQFSPQLQLAGKSGTTNDTRDSWFAGYSGNHLTVVWLGLDNNKQTGLTGSSGALPVWSNVMRQLHQKPVNIPQPTTVQWYWVDQATGALAAENCNNTQYIPMSQASLPKRTIYCGAEDEVLTPNTNQAPPSIAPPQPSYDGYIRESQPSEFNQTNNAPEMISSGHYSEE